MKAKSRRIVTGALAACMILAVSYTHLTLPTNSLV